MDDTPQIYLTIQTDYGHTADFLRELADAIESSEENIETYEVYHGIAEINWDEAPED
jgi:hypothetical protein